MKSTNSNSNSNNHVNTPTFASTENAGTHTKAETNSRIPEEEGMPEVLFITSFPPRECGIATYSQDLVNALRNQFSSTFNCSICALESAAENHHYGRLPEYILNTDEKNSFAKIAFKINKDEKIFAVVMQHEFGFFANNEDDFSSFFKNIDKPIVFVFHTVLPTPHHSLRHKVQEMARTASSVIVMTKDAAQILMDEYDVPAPKITIIPHGTHLVPPLNKEELKEKYKLSDKKILSTFGFLSENKGIAVTLDALPSIIKVYPDVLFLVLGKTHPSVVKYEGEKYRQMLEQKVAKLNIEHHVCFVNEYLSLAILLEYLQLTDIYLFTSNDPNQAVSGTFSYAMSAGCPIISTPIPHAKELLSEDTGLFFDFKDSAQLSKAVINVLDDQTLGKYLSLNSFQKMIPTAWENSAIAHAKLFERLHPIGLKLEYQFPKINLNHLKHLTTKFGVIQFSQIAQADQESGYTLDDNARALIATCQLFEKTDDTNTLMLIDIYLQFIKHCIQPDGKFINYFDKNKQRTTQNSLENLEDSNGRAIWAIGYLMSLKRILPLHIYEEAAVILKKALPHLEKMHSTRAMAFVIKGLYYQNIIDNAHLMQLFADRLVQMYRHEKDNNWHWFESYLTYANSVLPEALLCAYLRTNNTTYKDIAKESFDFLISKIFEGDKVSAISNKGWLHNHKAPKTKIGGEQPIELAYTIIALEKFYMVFEEEDYKQKAIIAFNWFLGANHLHQIIYNPCTGGCFDGLEEFNVNLNQGAESTLSYLMARLAIERITEAKKNDWSYHKPNLQKEKLHLLELMVAAD